jgi:hypothetical protein
MRRLIPHAVLTLLTVLALGAMLVSLQSAQKISRFSPPPAGTPAVVTAFRAVVDRTLSAGSFTMDGFLNYQVPDTTSTSLVSGPRIVVVGSTVYFELGTTAQATAVWGAAPLSTLANSYYGPQRALQLLHTLQSARSVTRVGNNFTVKLVVPADTVSPGNPGQVEVINTVSVSNDYITAVQTNLQGWVSIPGGTTAHIKWSRVDHYKGPQTTFSNYGVVPKISAPPAATQVKLATCGQMYQFVVGKSHVCSLFG